MQLVLHTGVHFTEEERLIKCLLRNKPVLSKRGVSVPGPSIFRGLVRDTLNAMRKGAPGPGAREVLLDVIMDDEDAQRLILSDANFFRTPATAMIGGILYPDGPKRISNMAQLFPEDDIQIFMAIRNPATLLPILYDKAANKIDAEFWGRKTALDVRWSDTLARLREAAPDVPVTVWCNEDAPLLWGHILRLMTGLGPEEPIEGADDLLASIMSEEGMTRFHKYLGDHPQITEMQRRRVIVAFLDKYALEDEIEEELDMPGWTEDLVDEMSEIYDADVAALAQIPGVTVIAP